MTEGQRSGRFASAQASNRRRRTAPSHGMPTPQAHSQSRTQPKEGPAKGAAAPASPGATGSTLSLSRSPFAFVDRFLPKKFRHSPRHLSLYS